MNNYRPNRPSEIIASQGKKQIGSLSSAERGPFVTVTICYWIVYTTTVHLPKKEDERRVVVPLSPLESIAIANATGWMQSPIFCDVVRTLAEACKPTRSMTRSFLILDDHKTHSNNLSFIEMA